MISTWQEVTLGSVLTKSDEWTEILPGLVYKQVTVRLWGKGAVLRGEIEGGAVSASRQRVVRAGQFILSRIDARNGALGLVPAELNGAIVTNDFPSFVVDHKRLMPAYLAWLSKTNDFVRLCQAASEGTTNRIRLQEDRFLAMPLLLPPLAEQQRIVARIDALASRIEEAKGLRAQAVAEVEALMGAVASDLTADPRWKAAPIREIADVRGGIQKSSKRLPGANPRRYLTVAHVQRNWIDTSDPRYFEVLDQELARWQLVAGDVLVVEGNGSASQIGRTALFRGEIDACVHQNHVIRVRPKSTVIDPEYLNAYLNSTRGQEQMRELSRTTSGLYNLSVGRIEDIQVPLPPRSEQRRIVAYLNSLQAKVDAVNRLQAETQAELDALLPAVLDRAFRGEL